VSLSGENSGNISPIIFLKQNKKNFKKKEDTLHGIKMKNFLKNGANEKRVILSLMPV